MDAREKIEQANELMGIVEALNIIGSDVADFALASMKIYCPFGEIFHADGGRTRAMRVYPATETAWCFAGCGYFTPVKMIAEGKDLSEELSAEWILEYKNFTSPDYMERWNTLMEAPTDTVDVESLAEALKVACSRIHPNWENVQLDRPVAHKFQQCVSLLPKVKTPVEADRWLNVAKAAMKQVLGDSSG